MKMGYHGNHVESGKKGKRTDALIARIARDRPDVLERMQKGDFSSVAAAAREAGIEFTKRKRTVTLSDNLDPRSRNAERALHWRADTENYGETDRRSEIGGGTWRTKKRFLDVL